MEVEIWSLKPGGAVPKQMYPVLREAYMIPRPVTIASSILNELRI